MPALLTRMSILPNRLSIATAIAATEASEVTSRARGNASGPISAAARSAAGSDRAVTATSAPSAASAAASAFPRPRLDPVTIATLSLRRILLRDAGDALDLDQNGAPQAGHLHGGSGGGQGREIGNVDFVETLEVVHVPQVHIDLEEVFERGAGARQHGLEVLQTLFGLRLDLVARYLSRSRVHGNLAGRIDHVPKRQALRSDGTGLKS